MEAAKHILDMKSISAFLGIKTSSNHHKLKYHSVHDDSHNYLGGF
jgi:hypothetical protein